MVWNGCRACQAVGQAVGQAILPATGFPAGRTGAGRNRLAGRIACPTKTGPWFRYTIQVQMAKRNMSRKECAAAILIAGAMHMTAATKIAQADFGTTRDGAPIRIYTLTNE